MLPSSFIAIAGRTFVVGMAYYGGPKSAIRVFRGHHPTYKGLVCYVEAAENDLLAPITPNAWARWARKETQATVQEETNHAA